jgi:hypothetical protein
MTNHVKLLVGAMLGFFSLFVIPNSSVGQESREELRELMQEQFTDQRFIDETLDQLGLPERLIPFMREHWELLYDTPELLDRVSDELWSLRNVIEDMESAEASVFAERIGLGLITDLAGAGLRRLPVEDQRRSFAYEVELAAELTPQACVNYINGVGPLETRQAINEILSQKDDEFIRGYLSLTRRAVSAELRNEWYSPMVGEDQINIGFQVLLDEFERVVSEQDRGAEMIDFISGIGNIDDPVIECAASLWLLAVATSIEGSPGDWVIQGITGGL